MPVRLRTRGGPRLALAWSGGRSVAIAAHDDDRGVLLAITVAPALATDCALAAPASASAGPHRPQFYVSPSGNDHSRGSRARPWRTIGHAAPEARPGATVHVAPGHYRGAITIERGGSPGRRVRFVSDRRWAASGAGSVGVVDIVGDHVTFEGFEVSGRGEDGTHGILVGGSHIAVVGNDIEVPCRTDTGNGGSGIVVGGGPPGCTNQDDLVEANYVHDIGIGPLDGSCRLVHGIYAAVPRVRVLNNIVALSATASRAGTRRAT